jgi:hypothetical protein
MKKVLMIHEIRDWMLRVDLSEYDEITFDDGLYSQYLHLNHFLQFNKPLKFFISTNIVQECGEPQNGKTFLSCSEAHDLFFKTGSKEHYMTWNQVADIYITPGCEIGGHSHSHNSYKGIPLKTLHSELKEDTEKMLKEFHQRAIKVKSFCYPYNKQHPLYESILRSYGIENTYGVERIAIEDLYHKKYEL